MLLSENGDWVGGDEVALRWFQCIDVQRLGHHLFTEGENSSAACLSVQ